MRPDILFLDMTLPDMTGVEVAEVLKNECQDLPVIVGLTGHLPSDIAEELAGSAVSFWVQKPMGFNELSITLHDAVERVRAEYEI